ncbi:accessory Sec system glycosyltransferase Asp1 [Fructobacillus sp. CRL 2054]|uniref:accessory Sec system glycosyltransferase Asp1 n=1 Tax=Fructobacillus sp. CRL 2054 TaxID=2763007 RepID=UPI0023796D69|nr:accessory Sec system glycosyltransferase Asp1 [Fructobacillus sp. CRL 2054]
MSFAVIPSWPNNFQIGQEDKQLNALIQQVQSQTEPFLVLPTYLPKWQSMRRQLGLVDVPYWSAFDALQKVSVKEKRPLQLEDLTWPKDAQFVRMFDRIIVLSGTTIYGTVFFTYPKADQIDRIDLLKKGKLSQQLTVDDRGFISRVLNYKDGQLTKASYLSQSGAVVAEQDCLTGQVQAILPDGRKVSYSQMIDLVQELTVAYLKAHHQGEALVANSELNYRIAQQVSFNRLFLWAGQEDAADLQDSWRSVSTDVQILQSQVSSVSGDDADSGVLIAPYPVHPKELVQRKNQTVLYIKVGDLDSSKQATLMDQAVKLFNQDENRTVIFEGATVPATFPARLEQALSEQLVDLHLDEQLLTEAKAHFVFLGEQSVKSRLQYLATSSLYVDLSKQPDLEVLATTVALGLPTFTAVKTAYSLLDGFDSVEPEELSDKVTNLLTAEGWQQAQEQLIQQQAGLAIAALNQQWQERLKK